jgi:hypothetical protein
VSAFSSAQTGQARLLLFQEIEKDAQRQIPTIQGLLLLGAKECSGGKIGRAWMLTYVYAGARVGLQICRKIDALTYP